MVSNYPQANRVVLRKASHGLVKSTSVMLCTLLTLTSTQPFWMKRNGLFRKKELVRRLKRHRTRSYQAKPFHTCLAWVLLNSMKDKTRWTRRLTAMQLPILATCPSLGTNRAMPLTLYRRQDQPFQSQYKRRTLSLCMSSEASSVWSKRTDRQEMKFPTH